MQQVGLHCGGDPEHFTEFTEKVLNVESLATFELSIIVCLNTQCQMYKHCGPIATDLQYLCHRSPNVHSS